MIQVYKLPYFLLSQARVHNYDGAIWGPPSYSVPAVEMIHEPKWVSGEFNTLVKARRQTIENAMRGRRAAGCEADAIATLLQHWCQGSPEGEHFSVAVKSEGKKNLEGFDCDTVNIGSIVIQGMFTIHAYFSVLNFLFFVNFLLLVRRL